MKKTFIKLFVASCFAFVLLTASGCHKEGIGGNASVSGTVLHHDDPIPNCVVYIKFNTTDFPGDNPSDYDSKISADATGKYNFSKLYKGDYYLYAVGMDSKIQEIVKGGISINLKRNKTYEQNVPVSEGH